MKKNNNFIIFLLSFNIFLVLATSFFGYKYFTNDSSVNQPIACREDAKICPDGSSVGRVAPSCEFSACPQPQPTGLVEQTTTYSNSQLGFSFEYPTKYVLTSNLENGQTGQKFTLWLTNQNSEKIIMGGVTRDYSAGRSGEFTDSQGYLKNSEGVFIKFVNKPVPINPLVFNNIITNPHNINVLYVIGQSDSFETSTPGDPGIGYDGAIINLQGKSFPGISLFYKTSPDNKIKSDFNYIVSSFKIL